MTCDVCGPLLHPYLDAELPLPEALAVERHMAECPECRRQHEELERLRDEIATSRLDYRPPRGLRWRIEGARRRWWGAAAAAAMVLLGVTWLMPGGAERELIDGHLRSLAASHLVDVPSSDRHTVKPWFQGKAPFSPSVPDLAKDGFPLLGGRLEVFRERRIAALVYQRREHVINVFAGEDLPATSRSEREGYHLNCWKQADLRYCAVSDLNSAELDRFRQLFTSVKE
jgi:anti-sigma factor RsiW